MRMHYSFTTLLDFIFPPSGEELCVRTLPENEISTLFALRTIDSVCALSVYRDGRIRALIHEAKFHTNKRAWQLLNALFQTYLARTSTDTTCIIPIPLSPARMRTRGYNQVIEILRARPLTVPHEISTDVLVRTRNTRPQTELKKNDRLRNMHDAFGVVHGERITGRHILLVDDVTTTGATLRAAKVALEKHHPASITCIAFAH